MSKQFWVSLIQMNSDAQQFFRVRSESGFVSDEKQPQIQHLPLYETKRSEISRYESDYHQKRHKSTRVAIPPASYEIQNSPFSSLIKQQNVNSKPID